MKKILLFACLTIANAINAQIGDRFSVDGLNFDIQYNHIISPDLNVESEICARVCPASDENGEYSGVIEIPANVTYNGESYPVRIIGISAFENCVNVSKITLPETISTIQRNAFKNCGNLDINIPSEVYNVYSNAFAGTELSGAFDFKGAGDIYEYAFAECSLPEITFGEKLYLIRSYAFRDSKIKQITFYETEDENASLQLYCHAFAYFDINELRFPKQKLTLTNEFCYNCPYLERIIIPDLDIINYIAEAQTLMLEHRLTDSWNMVAKCPALKEIVSFNDLPPQFNARPVQQNLSVLDDYSKCVLKVPAGSEDAYRADPTWGKFKHIEGFQPGEYAGVENVKRDDDANANTQVRKLFADGQGIHIELPEPCVAEIYNLAGTLVCRAEHPGGTFRTAVPQGVYLLRTTKH